MVSMLSAAPSFSDFTSDLVWVAPMGCRRSGAPAGALQRLQSPSGQIHLWRPRVLHRQQFEYLLQHGLLHWQQGDLCSSTWRTSSSSSPSFSGLALFMDVSHIFFLPSSHVLPILTYIVTEALAPCCQHLGTDTQYRH